MPLSANRGEDVTDAGGSSPTRPPAAASISERPPGASSEPHIGNDLAGRPSGDQSGRHSSRNDLPGPDDPVRLRSDRLFALFASYLAWRMSRQFCALRLSRTGPVPVAPGRAIVVYGNHPSWWDPAVFIVLAARLFPGRPGFGPMDEASFRRYGIFRRMGVFGIALDAQSGARRFLETSERVLALPGGMMWITAEGAFTDEQARPIRLRGGIAHLACRVPDTLMVPVALSYRFWDESRPEALVRFGEPTVAAALGPNARARDVAPLLASRLGDTMDVLATEAARRDPALFTAVVRGRTGADRIYDSWRRGRALLRGERFDPAHGASRRNGAA